MPVNSCERHLDRIWEITNRKSSAAKLHEKWRLECLRSNHRQLHEAESRAVQAVCEHQLQLQGYLARLPNIDPVNGVLSIRDNPGGMRPRDADVTRGLEKSIDHTENCSEWKDGYMGGCPEGQPWLKALGGWHNPAPRCLLSIDGA